MNFRDSQRKLGTPRLSGLNLKGSGPELPTTNTPNVSNNMANNVDVNDDVQVPGFKTQLTSDERGISPLQVMMRGRGGEEELSP